MGICDSLGSSDSSAGDERELRPELDGLMMEDIEDYVNYY